MANAGVAGVPNVPDTGCRIAPRCLTCPRVVCVLDDGRAWTAVEDVMIASRSGRLPFRSQAAVAKRRRVLDARPTFDTP